MRPTVVVLNIYQGQTFNDTVTLLDDARLPLPLASTYDGARMQIRAHRTGPVVLELTTANGRVAIDDGGRITFLVSAADTAALSTQFSFEQWVYDLELFSTAGVVETVVRPLMGPVVFWPEVTRDVV